MKLIATASNEGKTFKACGIQFINGLAEVPGNTKQHGGLITILARYHATYPSNRVPKGALKENGVSDIQESSERNQDEEIHSDLRPSGSEPSEVRANDKQEPTDSERGSEGSIPGGDGSKESGLTEQDRDSAERIGKALAKLDPKNDDHWTAGGLPMVDIVSHISGVPATRKKINLIEPEFTRPAKELQES